MRIINENLFDINKFRESKLAVNCKTEEDATIFLEMLNADFDINWDTNRTSSYKNKDGKYDTYWNLSFEKTVYRWYEDQILTHDDIEYVKGLKIEIVEFKSLNNKEYNNSEVESMKCNINNFDIERFKTGNYAIHCNTEEKARELLNYLDKEHCITWSHRLNNKDTAWKTFHKKTCYSYDTSDGTLGFCNYEYYKKNGTIIYEFEFQYPLTWIDFKLDNIVIHCKTDSQVNELSQWIYSNKDEEFTKEPLLCLAEGWNRYHNEVCYNYNLSEKKINFGTEDTYVYKNYEVIEWDGKKLYEINGTIETDMDIDELNDKFIDFIESINGEFAGGIK